jgi:hypothetical protein
MIFVRENCKPIAKPSADRLRKEIALVKSSFASLTRDDGSYVQIAGGPGLFLLEHRGAPGHRRAYQENPVSPHPDGTTLECSAGSIPMNRADWLLRDQVAEVLLAFSLGSAWPTYVKWRESPHAEHSQRDA